MKKIFLISTLSLIVTGTSDAATPWWLRPTVCRLNPTNCYSAMGSGFDAGMWDATANCWGLKMICPEALKSSANAPIAMGKNEIKKGTNINSDFDTDILSSAGDCFGARKTTNNGATILVNGKYVNVYCPGILTNPDEKTENGEIMLSAQPTCTSLAKYGYAAVENGKCFGKYYDSSNYFIECGTTLLPKRIIVLNGADYTAPGGTTPATASEADKLFDTMYSVSKNQKKKYFKE